MWKDISGHAHVVELLKTHSASGRVPHAFLFAGGAGLGKTRMAKEFFKALNCLETPGSACDKCGSCLKVMAGTHPDLTELNPESRWIKVDEVRGILSDVALKPFEARMKCIIIEPAEQLGNEGANALLKTLEEPPSSTVFILVSHRPKLLLPTIVSRCQLLRFNEDEGTRMRESENSSSDSEEKDAGTGYDPGIQQEIIALFKGSDPALLAKKYFDSEGWDILPEVLMAVETILRDIMVLRLGCDRVMHESLRGIPFRYAGTEEIDSITGLIRSVRRGVNENINLRVAATELFIQLSQLAGR